MAYTVELSHYVAAWWMLWCLHACCALYLAGHSFLFWLMDSPDLEYVAGLFVQPENRHFVAYGAVMMLLALLHGLSLLRMAYASIYARQFVFRLTQVQVRAPTSCWHALHFRTRSAKVSVIAPTTAPSSKLRMGKTRVVDFRKTRPRLWKLLTTDLISIRSPHFHAYFLTREIVEIVLQTSQAYRASTLVIRPWLVDLFVGAMVLNCWSTPLVATWYAHRYSALNREDSHEKAVMLALNAALQIVSCMVFPAIIFLRYCPEYDPQSHGFRIETSYNDLAFVSLLLEGRMVAPTSIFDFVCKVLPHWSIYSSTIQLSDCVVQRRIRSEHRSNARHPILQQHLPLPVRHHRIALFVHSLMVVCGVVVTMMHLHARLRGWDVEIQGCKKSLYPWGSSSYPCAVFHIDCGNRQDGSGSDDDFVGLNHESLLVLLFFHCPALRVPRAIRNFPNLQGIGIHHSTLVSWDVNAAFDVTTQSQVAYVEFVLVNFSTFPQALVDAPLPQTLTDIEFTHTNLTTLPPNLHEAWPSMEVLYLEFSQLQEIPSTLLQMDLYWLSLTGNNISNVSIISQTPVSMASLNLDRNPFHELPETMANAVSFAILGAQRTNVDSVPAWATSEHLSGQLQMYGTPYCERESPSDSSVVTCAAHVVGVYPFDYVESFHATTDV